MLVRPLPPRRRQAPLPEPVEHPEPLMRAEIERPLSVEDAARVATASMAFKPLVPRTKQ
nr:hypothetical protein [Methylorubrum zatmanii]